MTEAILEAGKELQQSILGECWDRVACRSEEAAAIYRCSAGNSRETSKGGWLTGGNLAREETQEQERKEESMRGLSRMEAPSG